MAPRPQLHQILKDLLGSDHVYFQPPPNTQINYPAIVYNRDFAETMFAGNFPYRFEKRYQVTLIAANPDEGTFDKIAKLPMCTFLRWFAKDELNHDVFQIYF